MDGVRKSGEIDSQRPTQWKTRSMHERILEKRYQGKDVGKEES